MRTLRAVGRPAPLRTPRPPVTLPQTTTLNLQTQVAEFARVAEALTRFVAQGLPATAAAEVRLVLEEAFTNIVKYAHADGGTDHPVHLHLVWHADRLEVELVDDGRAFDPLAHPAAELDKPFRERAEGRMGLAIIRGLMDECAYRREEGRNRLRLRKSLPPAL